MVCGRDIGLCQKSETGSTRDPNPGQDPNFLTEPSITSLQSGRSLTHAVSLERCDQSSTTLLDHTQQRGTVAATKKAYVCCGVCLMGHATLAWQKHMEEQGIVM